MGEKAVYNPYPSAVVDLPTAAMVDRLIGVVCVMYNLQVHLGQRVSTAPVGLAAASAMDCDGPG